MDNLKRWHLAIFFIVVLSWTCTEMTGACSARVSASRKEARQVRPEMAAQIDPTRKSWVEEQLIQGRSVVLTNSYLFYVMKGIAQENQKLAEETVLIPLLHQTLEGLLAAASDPDTRRLFGVALVLLAETPGLELPEQVVIEARAIRANPLFTPTGHYIESEKMERYFQAMQYLSKATIDVHVKMEAFPFPKEMLFPFDMAARIRRLFAQPGNARLLANWRAIHSFYDSINGASDLPTFVDLVDQLSGEDLTRSRVEAWMRQNRMPRINPEMGFGVQPFGERFSIHQWTIDDVKRRLLKDDMPRAMMAKILRFSNIMTGPTADGEKIVGLGTRVSAGRGTSYYAHVLRAIALGGRRWQGNPFRLNFFASSLTGLAEQTALMTRTSTMVAKSLQESPEIEKGHRLFCEPDSERFLRALARASASMVRACMAAQRKAGQKDMIEFSNPARAFKTLASLAGPGRSLITGTRKWQMCSPFLMQLARIPAVTVDVFRLKDRSGNLYYYQWAVAPFEVIHRPRKSRNGAAGLEMVFFEAWADDIVKNAPQGPLTNVLWQKRVTEGKLDNLPSILNVPGTEGELK